MGRVVAGLGVIVAGSGVELGVCVRTAGVEKHAGGELNILVAVCWRTVLAMHWRMMHV